jgi:DNA-binding NarL/FixJ family response regulator
MAGLVGADPLLVLYCESQSIARAIRAAVRQGGWQVHVHSAGAASLPTAASHLHAALVLIVVGQVGAALALSRQLRTIARKCPVVVMSDRRHAQPHEVLAVVREGAAGWLTLDMDPMRIPHALAGVLDGEPALPRHVMAGVLDELRHERAAQFLDADGAPVELTRRELEAARLFSQGVSTAVAASIMQVSQTTVRGYLAAVRKKLGIRKREHLLRVLDGTDSAAAITAS